MELEPGQIFARRYRVDRALARGGMGSVYVAQQLATEAMVALKVIDPRMVESESQQKAFKVEATVAGRVRSQHIVRTLDAGFDEATGSAYLVMELLDGLPLDTVIERDGPLPAATVALYVSQVAAGLDRAHGHSADGKPQPIVHRDLKPNNLMLTHREGGEPEIKILDFGIAKLLGQTTGVSREIKGTPSYMAFEQAAGERVTPQTDIWALGLIAFYLLTGKSYWRSASSPEGTLESLLGEVLALPLLPATERMRALGVTPDWPTEAFDAWFARCVHRDPTQRFGSAGLAAQALRQALLDPQPSGWSPTDSTTRTLLSKPPAVVARALEARTPSALAATPPAIARKPRWPWLVAIGVVLLVIIALLRPGRPASEATVNAEPPSSAAAAHAVPAATPAPAPTAAEPPLAPSAAGLAATPVPSGTSAAPEPARGEPAAVVPVQHRSAARRAAPRPAAASLEPPAQPPKEPEHPSAVPEPAPNDLYNRR